MGRKYMHFHGCARARSPPLQRQHGWRTAKRPGVDYFLAYVSQFYEVVIFTSQHSYVSGSDDEMLSRANVCLDCRAYSR